MSPTDASGRVGGLVARFEKVAVESTARRSGPLSTVAVVSSHALAPIFARWWRSCQPAARCLKSSGPTDDATVASALGPTKDAAGAARPSIQLGSSGGVGLLSADQSPEPTPRGSTGGTLEYQVSDDSGLNPQGDSRIETWSNIGIAADAQATTGECIAQVNQYLQSTSSSRSEHTESPTCRSPLTRSTSIDCGNVAGVIDDRNQLDRAPIVLESREEPLNNIGESSSHHKQGAPVARDDAEGCASESDTEQQQLQAFLGVQSQPIRSLAQQSQDSNVELIASMAGLSSKECQPALPSGLVFDMSSSDAFDLAVLGEAEEGDDTSAAAALQREYEAIGVFAAARMLYDASRTSRSLDSSCTSLIGQSVQSTHDQVEVGHLQDDEVACQSEVHRARGWRSASLQANASLAASSLGCTDEGDAPLVFESAPRRGSEISTSQGSMPLPFPLRELLLALPDPVAQASVSTEEQCPPSPRIPPPPPPPVKGAVGSGIGSSLEWASIYDGALSNFQQLFSCNPRAPTAGRAAVQAADSAEVVAESEVPAEAGTRKSPVASTRITSSSDPLLREGVGSRSGFGWSFDVDDSDVIVAGDANANSVAVPKPEVQNESHNFQMLEHFKTGGSIEQDHAPAPGASLKGGFPEAPTGCVLPSGSAELGGIIRTSDASTNMFNLRANAGIALDEAHRRLISARSVAQSRQQLQTQLGFSNSAGGECILGEGGEGCLVRGHRLCSGFGHTEVEDAGTSEVSTESGGGSVDAGPGSSGHQGMVRGLEEMQERLLAECRQLCLQCHAALAAEDRELGRLQQLCSPRDALLDDLLSPASRRGNSAKPQDTKKKAEEVEESAAGEEEIVTGSSVAAIIAGTVVTSVGPSVQSQEDTVPFLNAVAAATAAAAVPMKTGLESGRAFPISSARERFVHNSALRNFVAKMGVAQRLAPTLVAVCENGEEEFLRVVDGFVASFGRAVELLVAMRLVGVVEAPFAVAAEAAAWEMLAKTVLGRPCAISELGTLCGSDLFAIAGVAAEDLQQAYDVFHEELGRPSPEMLRRKLRAVSDAAPARSAVPLAMDFASSATPRVAAAPQTIGSMPLNSLTKPPLELGAVTVGPVMIRSASVAASARHWLQRQDVAPFPQQSATSGDAAAAAAAAAVDAVAVVAAVVADKAAHCVVGRDPSCRCSSVAQAPVPVVAHPRVQASSYVLVVDQARVFRPTPQMHSVPTRSQSCSSIRAPNLVTMVPTRPLVRAPIFPPLSLATSAEVCPPPPCRRCAGKVVLKACAVANTVSPRPMVRASSATCLHLASQPPRKGLGDAMSAARPPPVASAAVLLHAWPFAVQAPRSATPLREPWR